MKFKENRGSPTVDPAAEQGPSHSQPPQPPHAGLLRDQLLPSSDFPKHVTQGAQKLK